MPCLICSIQEKNNCNNASVSPAEVNIITKHEALKYIQRKPVKTSNHILHYIYKENIFWKNMIVI